MTSDDLTAFFQGPTGQQLLNALEGIHTELRTTNETLNSAVGTLNVISLSVSNVQYPPDYSTDIAQLREALETHVQTWSGIAGTLHKIFDAAFGIGLVPGGVAKRLSWLPIFNERRNK